MRIAKNLPNNVRCRQEQCFYHCPDACAGRRPPRKRTRGLPVRLSLRRACAAFEQSHSQRPHDFNMISVDCGVFALHDCRAPRQKVSAACRNVRNRTLDISLALPVCRAWCRFRGILLRRIRAFSDFETALLAAQARRGQPGRTSASQPLPQGANHGRSAVHGRCHTLDERRNPLRKCILKGKMF